ncbi:TetR/AcrR family transcriptional regulator C-terminal domain-containing protein [Ureibacillus sp. Re31]|uniref:TetR/AcrR family transcriptional regulator C-terminal domain-containing protein n=1 Tax=Ureibacillus galli TaxID=2762222 RepID=A0ABR8XDN5_9BACL|nr:TetR/AcrR family transcriptional regulator [Ureibacillus galli]MBD8027356.1 TetR/AcrR family transcriptional regulator C-terminal domain-containing protein [Ureibacillus galli]
MRHSDETKRILANSLKEMMKSKAIEKISIREITDNANVNRQTFYYHFEDIYDLLKWTFQQEAVQLLAVHNSAKIWQEGLLQLFHYLDDNRTICLNALQSLGRGDLKRFFYADIHNILERVVKEHCNNLQASEQYLSFIIHFYTISLGGLVESWLAGEMEQTPEEIIEMIDTFIQDQLLGAQERIKGQASIS